MATSSDQLKFLFDRLKANLLEIIFRKKKQIKKGVEKKLWFFEKVKISQIIQKSTIFKLFFGMFALFLDFF